MLGFEPFNKTTIEEAIEYIENGFMNKIFEEIKTGNQTHTPFMFLEAYNVVQKFYLVGDKKSEELFQSYNRIIEKYIIDCKNELNRDNKTNLVDKFLLYTKNIYYVIYWAGRVFCFLDRFYMKFKKKETLARWGMNLYKTLFFEEFKNDVLVEINKLKNEEKDGSTEPNDKIQGVMQIFKDVEIKNPKLSRENGEIKWIEMNQ